MEFEWDPAKDAANQTKHGISFVAATAIFADPAHLEEDVTRPEFGEVRKKAIGQLTSGWTVAVIYTDRGDRRRIISARRARTNERQRYDQSKTTP
jgi:uncharacterized DUF497 family protein